MIGAIRERIQCDLLLSRLAKSFPEQGVEIVRSILHRDVFKLGHKKKKA